VRRFRWLRANPVPPWCDLRRFGWTLLAPDEGEPDSCPVLLDDLRMAATITAPQARATTILLGIDDSEARADWLAQGFGETLPSQLALYELETRAMRVRQSIESMPRRRRHGPLDLDLLLRDGMVDGRRLGLHPREFSLLWRLAETPGRPVPPDELLAEVWQMSFRPETNSLAVHVCRLRAKLAAAGLGGIVSTTHDGCYALAPERDGPDPLRRRLAMECKLPQSGIEHRDRKPCHET
jgi:DNA-binding response OmpR family regulator